VSRCCCEFDGDGFVYSLAATLYLLLCFLLIISRPLWIAIVGIILLLHGFGYVFYWLAKDA
jgi:hypothetical protein